MLPAERLGRILGALLGEGRPRTLRGAACREAVGRRPSETVPPGAGRPYGDVGLLGQFGVPSPECRTAAVLAGQEASHVRCLVCRGVGGVRRPGAGAAVPAALHAAARPGRAGGAAAPSAAAPVRRPACRGGAAAGHRRPGGELRAVAVGAGLWAFGHWLFARSRGYYAGALGRRMLRAVPLPGLDPTGGHEQRPVYEYVPRPVALVLGR